MSNPDILLEYLKKVKKATSAEIYRDTGIWRVSDSVFKLRARRYKNEEGWWVYPYLYNLKTTMIKAKNRRGKDGWVGEYSLK